MDARKRYCSPGACSLRKELRDEVGEGAGTRGTTKRRNKIRERVATLAGKNKQLEEQWRKVRVLWGDGR